MDAQQPPPPPPGGDGLTSHIAGMSKTQLYDIMCQMKALIDQNQPQARHILIENPRLTRALFQAQIMLGMVRPPQVMPNIQKTWTQPQSAQMGLQSDVQSTQSLPVEVGLQGQASSSQPLIPLRQHHPIQTGVSASPLTFQSQPIPSSGQQSTMQTKGFLNAQIPSAAPSQSSQIHNVPLPPPVSPQYSVLHSHLPISSQTTQQSLQTPGHLHQPLAPPLPQLPRPHSMHPFSHQLHSQMNNLGFQPSGAPQMLLSQPLFHGSNPSSSFPQGPPPLPSQPPFNQSYQGGTHLGPDYARQAGSSMQAERAPWAPGLPENATAGTQLPGPLPLVPGQMGPGTSGQMSRPPPLTPEMEKALLQQVMSLTPDQINLLPPEQRQQVIQLQEMLR